MLPTSDTRDIVAAESGDVATGVTSGDLGVPLGQPRLGLFGLHRLDPCPTAPTGGYYDPRLGEL